MEMEAVLVAGFLATTVMISIMGLIHRLRWANANMVRAIGSLFTKSHEFSVFPGLLIQYSAGLSFALLYSMLISVLPVDSGGAIVITTLLAGLVHGVIFSLLLTILVAEHHPLAEFRDASFGVLVAHAIGHVFYGGTLGLVFAFANAKQNWLTSGFPVTVAHEAGALVGFGGLWLILFGMPLVFAGYVVYLVLAARFRRIAHEADVATGHDSQIIEDQRMVIQR